MAAGEEVLNLSDSFEVVWKIQKFVQETTVSTSSDSFQQRLLEGIRHCHLAIRMVNELDLFSSNEELEEIATNELRYMLLSAFLGLFLTKQTSEDRMVMIKMARAHYADFLQLCQDYGLTDVELPILSDIEEDGQKSTNGKNSRTPRAGGDDVLLMAKQRQSKIQRFKEQKEREKHLEELYAKVNQEHVEEEVKREYYITLVKKWIATTLEELECIQSEIPILEHMLRMKQLGTSKDEHANKDNTLSNKKGDSLLSRPFIITRNRLEKQVFGAGYPSLPTYTVEEFYDQQVALGRLPGPDQQAPNLQDQASSASSEAAVREREDVEKERKIEQDDAETLQKARDWDEWKDDHRRGWGNTQNKG